MATMLGSLLVSLGMESAQFKRGMKDAKSEVTAFSKFAKVGMAAVAAGATAAAGAFALMVRQSINVADQISKAAQSIGIGTEELSRLRYAADLSGVSFEQLQTGVGRLSRNMLDASRGLGTAQRAFQRLGIDVTNSDGTLRSATEIMGDVADRFSNMKDGAEKTALAMEIFGRAGATLIPMLNGGRDGLRALTEEADKFGIVIDTETGRKAEAFNDNLTRLTGQFEALAIRIAADLLPHLVTFTEWLIKNQGEIVKTVGNIGDFISGVAKMAQGVANGVAWMEERFGSLRRAIAFAIGPLNTLVNLAMRLGGSGGGSGGAMGQTASAMMSMGQQAVAMAKAMGTVESSGNGAAKAVDRVGGAVKGVSAEAERARQQIEALVARLFPAATAAKKFREELAAINGSGLSDEEKAFARAVLRTETSRGKSPVSGAITDAGPIVNFAKQAQEAIEEFGQKSKIQAVRIAQSFADMTRNITSSLQGLANSIRSGDFLGILGGVLDLFTNLGSAGVFGSGLQGRLNRVPGNANGTRNFAGGLSVVGERGPELVNLPRRSQVIPNHKLNGMGGGGIAQIVPSPYFDVVVDGRVMRAAPAVASAGAMQAQTMAARSARRSIRR
jgi:hypothetical protein